MTHHGEWSTIPNHGNPTRDKSILAMIARIRKFQTRNQGKKSRVKRDMTMNEFRIAIETLEAEPNNWSNMKWASALCMQFQMIRRGDCVHHIQRMNFSQHPQFDFALHTKLNWSKNVRDERNCPWQIMLGAMSTAFCGLLSLAICLEVRFATFGTDSKFLYTEEHSKDLPEEEAVDDPAPLASLAACSKQVASKVFGSARFIALAAPSAGSVGMHSVSKMCCLFCQENGINTR